MLSKFDVGHLLTRFAEKGLSFRVTSNPVERSIMWKMNVPDHIAKVRCRSFRAHYPTLMLMCYFVSKELQERKDQKDGVI